MSFPNDPLLTWRRRNRRAVIAGVAITSAVAIWALQPLPAPAPSILPDTQSAATFNDQNASSSRQMYPIDLDVLGRVQLWNPPASPIPEAAPQVRQVRAPLTSEVELLAIVREGSKTRAALFDPVADRVVFVGAGEVIAGLAIKAVHDAGVILTDGAQDLELILKQPGAPRGALESMLAQQTGDGP